MLAYVAHHARANRPGSDGSTVRAHWAEKARRGDASALALLDGPPFPESLSYLYGWFVELSNARGSGMNGPDPITYPALDAWARLTGNRPQPHEVAAIMALDVTWRSARDTDDEASGRVDDASTPTDQPRALRPMAPWPEKRHPSGEVA